MKRLTKVIAIGGLAVTMMGASCFDVTEPLELTFNVEDVTNTYSVPVGITTFGSPQSCGTVTADEYADTEFDITNARVSDITLQTIGTFDGSIANGTVTVNGSPAITFSGPWNSFNTEQSLLTTELLTVDPAGVTALVNAVKARQPLTVCSTGNLSQATTAGLQVKVGIKAQMDVTP